LPKALLYIPILGLGIFLASCGGSDATTSQSRDPLRLNVRLDTAFIDETYNAIFTADGGVRPYKFSLDGNLPKGLSYSAGRISGTPTEKGSFEVTVTVEDANLSSRVQKATLVVGEVPPPQLTKDYPLAEQTDPFIYRLSVRTREIKGFQAQILLKDIKPALDSLKAADNLLYVTRYDPETRLLDIDAMFVTPRKDVEILRVNLAPDKALRPQNQIVENFAFYDKNSKLVPGNPQIDRVAAEGKYTLIDLAAIARNWGKKLSAPAPSTPAGSQPATPQEGATPGDQKSELPQSDSQAAAQQKPETPAQPAGESKPDQPATQVPKAEQPTDKNAVEAKTEDQAPQPEQKPTQAQPQAPSTPAPAPQKLEGDLNEDGLVDAKDLEILRSSYTWASVAGVKTDQPPQPAQPTQPTQPNTDPGTNPNPDNPGGGGK